MLEECNALGLLRDEELRLGLIAGSSDKPLGACWLLVGTEAGMLSILRTGSPVEVNIFGDSGTIKDAVAEGCLGIAGGKGALLLSGTFFDGDAGARFRPPGNVGNVKFGLATPDPIGALLPS